MNSEALTMQIIQYSSNGARAILAENLRRNWPVSLVFFLILFCTSVLPAIIDEYTQAATAISGENPMFVIVELLLPVITANIAFRYLYTSSGTTIVHAFPLSRRSLFRGAFLSGLVLAFAPAVATMLTVLPMCKMRLSALRMDHGIVQFQCTADTVDITGWLLMAFMGLIAMFFVYALAVYAAILTGTGSAQAGVSFTLNFLLIFICIFVIGYLESFLIGFDTVSGFDMVIYLNPLVFFSATGIYSIFSAGLFLPVPLIYLGVACAVAFAASRLYGRRKLEHAGSPFCFRTAELMIVYLVTLVGMAGMGMIFSLGMGGLYEYSIPGLVTGCVLGAVIVFMVMTMLSQKTLRVFTLRNLKSFGIFAIIGALFVASTAFDITGYTDRVPAAERVESAKLSLMSYPYLYPYGEMYSFPGWITVEAAQPGDLRSVGVVHRGLIECEKAKRGNDDWYENYGSIEWSGSARLTYELKGSLSMSRHYTLYYKYANDELREELAGMPAFREAVTLESLVGHENISSVSISKSYFDEHPDSGIKYASSYAMPASREEGGYEALNLPENKLRELAQCMDRDFLALSAQEIAGTQGKAPETVTIFHIEYRNPDEDSSQGFYTRYLLYTVTSFNKETVAWMERNLQASDVVNYSMNIT